MRPYNGEVYCIGVILWLPLSLLVTRLSIDSHGSNCIFRLNVSVCCVNKGELRSCVKVEVAVLGSPSLIVRTVSVDVKQN